MKYPDAGITENSIRWLIFNGAENGFSRCIVRMGRKVLIDLDKFESWMDEQAANGGAV
ncbi:MAG: DNA-binding protein [Ketobacter sp. GenoA1]|nr:MAG: DNA-binding protein [Ketobacter sp. GenoA1]RLT99828.1 MAG: DNA-binding protein [Ketobacter sp.]